MRRNYSRPLAAALAAAVVLSTACATTGDPDPWRPLNEKTHAFNEAVDQAVLEPVAKGWNFAVPGFVRTGVGNFFDNLTLPRTVLNDLLQGKPDQGLRHSVRFLINTTLGIGGVFDPAGENGLEHEPEDFAQTLGHWGVGAGPYLVLPFMGPATVRDLGAFPVDSAANPLAWALRGESAIGAGLGGLDLTNSRARVQDELAESRASQLNYYVFLRDAYLQNLEKNVRDGAPIAAQQSDDLYDFDEEEDADSSEDADSDSTGNNGPPGN